MNLRFPIVAAVVAVAAGTAAVRALHSSPASVPFITEAPAVAGRPARQRIARLPERIVVYVAGAVQHAGLYTLPAASRVADALRAAGGPTRDADLVAVNLAQVLSDGDEVAVAAAGDEASVPAAHRRTSHRAKHSHHQRKRRRRPMFRTRPICATNRGRSSISIPRMKTNWRRYPASVRRSRSASSRFAS
jgi:hypothetical protein